MSVTPTDSTKPNDPTTDQPKTTDNKLSVDKAIDVYKFYQEAAEGTKGHAWSQTTWILTLNAGILAFSANLYAERREEPKLPLEGFLAIAWISAAAGVFLCYMLFYVLGELGRHIRNDWNGADGIRDRYPALKKLIHVPTDEKSLWQPLRKALGFKEKELPRFCRRLRWFAVVFIFADLVWALIVTQLVLPEVGRTLCPPFLSDFCKFSLVLP